MFIIIDLVTTVRQHKGWRKSKKQRCPKGNQETRLVYIGGTTTSALEDVHNHPSPLPNHGYPNLIASGPAAMYVYYY
jgi:hypothetical protein